MCAHLSSLSARATRPYICYILYVYFTLRIVRASHIFEITCTHNTTSLCKSQHEREIAARCAPNGCSHRARARRDFIRARILMYSTLVLLSRRARAVYAAAQHMCDGYYICGARASTCFGAFIRSRPGVCVRVCVSVRGGHLRRPRNVICLVFVHALIHSARARHRTIKHSRSRARAALSSPNGSFY